MGDTLIFCQFGRIGELDVPPVEFCTGAAFAIGFAQNSRKVLQARPIPLKYRTGVGLLNRVFSQNRWFDCGFTTTCTQEKTGFNSPQRTSGDRK